MEKHGLPGRLLLALRIYLFLSLKDVMAGAPEALLDYKVALEMKAICALNM